VERYVPNTIDSCDATDHPEMVMCVQQCRLTLTDPEVFVKARWELTYGMLQMKILLV
jgi:hypothetical protein